MASATAPAPAPKKEKEGWGQRRLSGFTKSKKFIGECERTFSEVDLDKSGNIDVSELYVAYLLLLHKVNKMPMVGSNEPPTAAEIQAMFRKYAKPGATSLDKDQFIAVCQDLCSGLAKNVTKHIITSFVIAPLIALGVKALLKRTLCQAVPKTEKALPFVPDSLFLPIAVAAFETGTKVTGA